MNTLSSGGGPSLAVRLAAIDERVADAARRAGRESEHITRIVVTKFHPASLVHDLAALGVRDVAENRQQELTAKRAELADDATLAGVRWHFVGQAQTNKGRQIRAAADAVHSVDRARLVTALDAAAPGSDPVLDVLLQVNLTDDPGRGGVVPDELEALAEQVAAASTLRLRGIMAVAPLEEEPRRAFARVGALSARLRTVVPDAGWISAGMTADFEDAIAEGATHLRIGSAITGNRPLHG